MSSQDEERRLLLEEKRRAARRARVLGNSGNRLDTICGIPNANPEVTKAPVVAEVRPTETKSEIPASSPISTSPPSSSTPIAAHTSPIDIYNAHSATKSRLPDHSTPEKLPQIHSPSPPVESLPSSPSTPWIAPTVVQEADIELPGSESSLLTRKRGFLIGILFATLLGVCTILYPIFSIPASIIFLALDLAMWIRALKPRSDNSSFTSFTAFLAPSQSATPLNPFAKLISYGQAAFYTSQDWLISRFVIIVILYLTTVPEVV